MTDFDCIVFGGGTGNTVASAAAAEGLETALVEKGPLGGLCLNRGCNPSKMLIEHARTLERVRNADQFGIDTSVEDVRFEALVQEVNDELAEIADEKEETKRSEGNLTLFREEARFVDDHTIELADTGETHSGDRIVVAAGSEPAVPNAIDGLEDISYLTSTDALQFEAVPEELVILGGGYIAAELGYYFDTFGSDVTLIEASESLLAREDDDVAEEFTAVAGERHDVHTGYRVSAVAEAGEGITATAESEAGEAIEVTGSEILVALGRKPNTEGIGLDATNVETTDAGFIETDSQLRTNVDGVWAIGDIAENGMFKHSGDYEGEIAIDNVARGKSRQADFTALPHVIFTEPQIGAVGKTEAELDDEGIDYQVGRAEIADTAMARALKLDRGFAKVLADPDSREILGCHIVGHEASMLIHEAAPAMRYGGTVDDLASTLLHAHPALNKVLMKACKDVPDDTH
ncbi:dihydrolipoamide dehydrogenase [Halobacteriales archaeon QS_3_64_16]|nr:MAG: dihydrolipoamide dehydrogenase [Halobacteriales archaeon QS_3_64_16]